MAPTPFSSLISLHPTCPFLCWCNFVFLFLVLKAFAGLSSADLVSFAALVQIITFRLKEAPGLPVVGQALPLCIAAALLNVLVLSLWENPLSQSHDGCTAVGYFSQLPRSWESPIAGSPGVWASCLLLSSWCPQWPHSARFTLS